MPKNYLREILREKRITAAKLAEKIGVTPALISQYANNQVNISEEKLNKILDELEITKEYLLNGEDQIDSDIIFRASRIVHEYYHDSDYSEKIMASIAKSLYYQILSFKEDPKKGKDLEKFILKLERNYIDGLASKCYANYLDSSKTNKSNG